MPILYNPAPIASSTVSGYMTSADKSKLDGINLLGVKLNTTALTPDANGYVSIPLMTGATSSAAGATGLVPAPTSADYEKFLCGDGTWQDGGRPMVILSYGNSTWNDFITAYQNNVIVYCRASSNSNPASGSQTRMAFMAYVSDATNPTNVEFQYYRSMNTHSATAMGDEVYVYKLTNAGVWSVTVRKASVKEIDVASGSKLGVSWSSDKVTLSNTMTADDMPMSSSDATTTKAAIDALDSKITMSTVLASSTLDELKSSLLTIAGTIPVNSRIGIQFSVKASYASDIGLPDIGTYQGFLERISTYGQGYFSANLADNNGNTLLVTYANGTWKFNSLTSKVAEMDTMLIKNSGITGKNIDGTYTSTNTYTTPYDGTITVRIDSSSTIGLAVGNGNSYVLYPSPNTGVWCKSLPIKKGTKLFWVGTTYDSTKHSALFQYSL